MGWCDIVKAVSEESELSYESRGERKGSMFKHSWLPAGMRGPS